MKVVSVLEKVKVAWRRCSRSVCRKLRGWAMTWKDAGFRVEM